jgi:hypothetical protein
MAVEIKNLSMLLVFGTIQIDTHHLRQTVLVQRVPFALYKDFSLHARSNHPYNTTTNNQLH